MDSNETSLKRQKIEKGTGPEYHRIYRIQMKVPFASALETMARVQQEPNKFSPQLLAKFEKTKGKDGQMSKGDEFQIHLPGPWNGPVRVTEVTEKSFHLVTLEGHLEAGEINFLIFQDGKENSIFEIESLARSRDSLVDLVYDKIPIVKLAQTEMWTMFCESFAGEACGSEKQNELSGPVEILTEKFDKETGEWQTV